MDVRPVVVINGVDKRQDCGTTLEEFRGRHSNWYLVDEDAEENEHRSRSFVLQNNTRYILKTLELTGNDLIVLLILLILLLPVCYFYS